MGGERTRRALRVVLGDSDERGLGRRAGQSHDEDHGQAAFERPPRFPEEELDAMLADWAKRERSRVMDLLAAALAAAAIAGFIAAVKEWAKKLSIDLAPKPAMLQRLRDWAKAQASKLFERVAKLMRRGAKDIVDQGRKEGLSREEIKRRLHKFLRKQRATTDHVNDVARDGETSARNRGSLAANRALGARTKMWLTRRDPIVCEKCMEREAQGFIPIDEPFSGGHMQPPAHAFCRCVLRYRGVTVASAATAMAPGR